MCNIVYYDNALYIAASFIYLSMQNQCGSLQFASICVESSLLYLNASLFIKFQNYDYK